MSSDPPLQRGTMWSRVLFFLLHNLSNLVWHALQHPPCALSSSNTSSFVWCPLAPAFLARLLVVLIWAVALWSFTFPQYAERRLSASQGLQYREVECGGVGEGHLQQVSLLLLGCSRPGSSVAANTGWFRPGPRPLFRDVGFGPEGL